LSFYLEVLAVQRPFFIGTDDAGRAMLSVNFIATARQPVAQFEEEIGRIIFDAGLGTFGTNMFVGPSSSVPSGEGPFVHIIDSGGTSPLETHNGDKYERLSCQVVVRANNRKTARTRALAIWRALDGQRNFTVVAA
jgi:hypothetical protein